MKSIFLILAAMLLPYTGMAQGIDTLRHEVLLETTMGNIRIALYNETPRHRDNFLKLAREGYYVGILFLRFFGGFLFRTGDSPSRLARPEPFLGTYRPTYPLPAKD